MIPTSNNFNNVLPIIVIFEQHWDKAPKEVLKHVLPQLSSHGYDTLCYEVPKNLNELEIITGWEGTLEFCTNLTNQAQGLLKQVGFVRNVSEVAFTELIELLRLYVSSKRYVEVAERIKELPGSIVLNEIIHNAKQLSFTIKGIDIDEDDFHQIVSADLTKKLSIVKKNEVIRIKTFTDNLFELYKEGKGLIFPCGVLHAGNVMAKFKEKNMQDHVLYYFPHSETLCDDENALTEVKEHSPELKNHSYCILNENDKDALANRIIKDIKSKQNPYQEGIVEGTSATVYLSQIFKVDCNALIRPGYFVDAVIDTNQVADLNDIKDKLYFADIESHQTILADHSYLVIPSVNTEQVSSSISRLRYF
ncbi:MAG TPA: hypothetical protein VGP47_09405 [Parachlamydiaceae bacterium]|nr:hypothetical protein [Nitrosopumilus sp.]HEV8052700.1 hypothetical protein [Parachlamydiaceae bacterium]